MRIRIKIFIITIVTAALFLICIHILINIKGKSLLAKKLEETFNRKVNIGSLSTSFPANIYVKNIEVKDLFKIDEVYAGGGLFDIFRRTFRLSKLKLTRPVVTIERGLVASTTENFITPDLNLQNKIGDSKAITPNLNPMTVSKGEFLFPRFFINHLIVSDGAINFIDKKIDSNGLLVRVNNLNIKVDNLNLNTASSRITSFELKGDIPWLQGQEEGKIEAEGWLNLFKKDMEATVKIENIDGIYLYPYYSNWVDLEKTRIQKAKLNFSSNIHALNNNVTAECHLELMDIDFKPRPAEEEENKAEKITAMVLDIFKTLNQGKIVLDFTVRTKMDQPQFGFSSVRNAFEEKLTQARKSNGLSTQQVLGLPATIVKGTFKGLTDLTTAVVTGTISAGKEVAKTVKEAFRREKKE